MPAKTKNFGWIDFSQRTPEIKQAHINALLEMQPFRLIGSFKEQQKVCLWEPVLALNKKHLPTLYQEIGSCTGCGKSKAETYLTYSEVVMKGEREVPKLIYSPYGYAQGRVCANISGNQDGGTGSGIAKAAKKYGAISTDTPGLPAFKLTETQVTFSGKVEKDWGNRGAPSGFIQEGVTHPVQSVSLIKSAEDVAVAIQNYYPVVICSNWGGVIKVPVKGTKYPVLLNYHADNWPHCMCIDGFWFNPELGEIFHISNSWGPNAHGKNPDNAPPGGFWVVKKDISLIISEGDSYVYGNYIGYPAQDVGRALFDLVGKQD